MNHPVRHLLLFGTLLALQATGLRAQIPQVSAGSIVRIDDLESDFVPVRPIDVWLPAGYGDGRSFAVVYMHDAAALFDVHLNWTGKEWGVDEIADELISGGAVRDFIVVAVPNAGLERHAEYLPGKPYDSLSAGERERLHGSHRADSSAVFHAPMRSDDYLRFLVEELKPRIDRTFDVRTGREHTFIMGSSMGGLISIYALCEYPDVFGGVAALSTHWPGIFTLRDNPFPDAMLAYLSETLPSAGRHRIYFDHGTAGLDSLYGDIQRRVDDIMGHKGYDDTDWVTRVVPGADHNEDAWRSRLHLPLQFLLGP